MVLHFLIYLIDPMSVLMVQQNLFAYLFAILLVQTLFYLVLPIIAIFVWKHKTGKKYATYFQAVKYLYLFLVLFGSSHLMHSIVFKYMAILPLDTQHKDEIKAEIKKSVVKYRIFDIVMDELSEEQIVLQLEQVHFDDTVNSKTQEIYNEFFERPSITSEIKELLSLLFRNLLWSMLLAIFVHSPRRTLDVSLP